MTGDRKSTRLNSSHLGISYAVFCLKKKRKRKGMTSFNGMRCCFPPRHGSELSVAQRLERGIGRPREGSQRLFFFNDTATPDIYTLSPHDALPISVQSSYPPSGRNARPTGPRSRRASRCC